MSDIAGSQWVKQENKDEIMGDEVREIFRIEYKSYRVFDFDLFKIYF